MTFNESDYDQTNATGFINLWGLPDTVLALREQGSCKISEGGAPSDRPPPVTVRLVNAARGARGKVFSAGTRPAENVFTCPAGKARHRTTKTTGRGGEGSSPRVLDERNCL